MKYKRLRNMHSVQLSLFTHILCIDKKAYSTNRKILHALHTFFDND